MIVKCFLLKYYPTSIRATGLGICFSFSRLGCMLTPFVAQVLIKQSPHLAITIYASLTFIIAILVFLLPETKGKGLRVRIKFQFLFIFISLILFFYILIKRIRINFFQFF